MVAACVGPQRGREPRADGGNLTQISTRHTRPCTFSRQEGRMPGSSVALGARNGGPWRKRSETRKPQRAASLYSRRLAGVERSRRTLTRDLGPPLTRLGCLGTRRHPAALAAARGAAAGGGAAGAAGEPHRRRPVREAGATLFATLSRRHPRFGRQGGARRRHRAALGVGGAGAGT
eukprot:1180652-Prorocentrum_minimum.AAC.4